MTITVADEYDQRRLDLAVPGLNVYEGLPLFCDATIISLLIGAGKARSGTRIEAVRCAVAQRNH